METSNYVADISSVTPRSEPLRPLVWLIAVFLAFAGTAMVSNNGAAAWLIAYGVILATALVAYFVYVHYYLLTKDPDLDPNVVDLSAEKAKRP